MQTIHTNPAKVSPTSVCAEAPTLAQIEDTIGYDIYVDDWDGDVYLHTPGTPFTPKTIRLAIESFPLHVVEKMRLAYIKEELTQ